MYLSEKPRPIDFYKDSSSTIELIPPPPPTNHDPPRHLIGEINNTNNSSGGSEEPNGCNKGTITKKRAETWVTEETKTLINLRRQVDNLFNTSKSNKHLWEGISNKMREKGFDRSPTMCTDKWRNLLKEYKKIKQQQHTNSSSNGDNNSCGKVLYYKELEELLRDRSRGGGICGGGGGGGGANSTVKLLDSFIQFSDKGIEDASITFGPVEAGGRSAINLETHLDHDGDPLPIATADAVAANDVPPWNWRETPPGNGEGQSSYEGRVISVKWGEYTRRIGIDGTSAAIKDAIKSAFRLRTKRAFWLEDEDQVIRSFDRDMPLGNYTLHLDEGITIKVCIYDDANRIMVRNEEKTLYTEEDFCDFLTRRGLAGLRELNGYRSIDTLDDLRSGGVYEGVRSG